MAARPPTALKAKQQPHARAQLTVNANEHENKAKTKANTTTATATTSAATTAAMQKKVSKKNSKRQTAKQKDEEAMERITAGLANMHTRTSEHGGRSLRDSNHH
jgi:cell division septum initiation protein DivIVA